MEDVVNIIEALWASIEEIPQNRLMKEKQIKYKVGRGCQMRWKRN